MSDIMDMEEPLLELCTAAETLHVLSRAMDQKEDEGKSISMALEFISTHLEHIHGDLYSKWEAARREARGTPKLAS